jgi:hypothetical protein
MKSRWLACCALLALNCSHAIAQAGRGAAAAETVAEKRAAESPWMIVPTFSVSPKLGASLGALGAYLHYFDEKSQVSMFGVSAQYTSTGSMIGGAFGKASFDEDRQRLILMMFGGNIKNDYDDFLGTGQPLHTEDELRATGARYLYRVYGDWFAGAQAIYTNFTTFGQNPLDDQVLNVLGLTGFTSGGVGAAAYHDSRDNESSATRGWLLNLNNIAYREWIAGSNNFDVYRADFRDFWSHGNGNVFALRQNNHWTVGAPPSAFPSVMLRGYKQGQYLGRNMSSIELEERLRIAEKWTATVFTGVACLYGDGKDCTDKVNAYPDIGAGIQYVLKPQAGIVVNLEYAAGKAGNYGILLKMGYGY